MANEIQPLSGAAGSEFMKPVPAYRRFRSLESKVGVARQHKIRTASLTLSLHSGQ